MQHRIIVLGAGYTGAIAAGRLARRLRREDVAITLVNAAPDFVERVRMHQLAVGQDLKPRPLSEIFAGTGVELRLAKVTGVDVDGKTVTLVGANGEEELGYDTLVYALGSGWNTHGVPGTTDHAFEIASRPGALRLRARLGRLDAEQPVVIVGGGLGDWLSPKGRQHLWRVFDKLGITAYEHATVSGVEADRVVTVDGTGIPAAVTVWTTGFAVHPIAKATALEVTGDGQIVVDGTMRSVSHPDVYAIGDAAYAMGRSGSPLRMSCATGGPMAWQAADAIAARLTGGGLPNVSLRYLHQCISLGRKDALIQYVTADDRAVQAVLTGRLAVVYKELLCRGAVWAVANPMLGLPTRRRRVIRRQAAAGSAVQAMT